jgi:hypothetical protein
VDEEDEEASPREGRWAKIASEEDLGRPTRGEVFLGAREAVEVGAVEYTEFDGNVGDDVTVAVDVEEAVVRTELLLGCVRCCGRDVTANDEGGRRSRMGMGTILFSPGGGDGDGDFTTDARAGESPGIMNRKAGMISSSTWWDSGEMSRTAAIGSGEDDTKLRAGRTDVFGG